MQSLAHLFPWIFRICVRPSLSGKLNSTFRSRRPGRSRAGSRVSGLGISGAKGICVIITYLFVAMMTLMFPLASNPSNWLINSNIVRCTSLSPPAPSSKRAPPIASTSSKKMIHAFFDRAISNSSRTIRAPSPMYFCTSSDPITGNQLLTAVESDPLTSDEGTIRSIGNSSGTQRLSGTGWPI